MEGGFRGFENKRAARREASSEPVISDRQLTLPEASNNHNDDHNNNNDNNNSNNNNNTNNNNNKNNN